MATRILIPLLMLLLPVERLATIEVGATTIRPVFGVMLIIVCVEAARPGTPWASNRTMLGAMRFLALGMAAICVSFLTDIWPHASAGYVAWLLFSAIFMLAAIRSISVDAAGSYWSLWAIRAASFWSLVAVIQWLLAASVAPDLASSFAGPIPRVHALTLEPSYLALYLLPHVFLAHQLGRRRELILIVIALFLSTSRLGIVGLIVGMAAFLLLDPSRRRHAASFVLGLLAVAAVALTLLVAVGAGSAYAGFIASALDTAETSSTAPRLESWTQAWTVASSHLAVGTGPGGYGEAAIEDGVLSRASTSNTKTTNLWLETLAELGLLGLLGLITWSIVPLFPLWRRARLDDLSAGLFIGSCSVVAVFALFQTWERPYVWVWWSMCWAVATSTPQLRAAAITPGRPAPSRVPLPHR